MEIDIIKSENEKNEAFLNQLNQLEQNTLKKLLKLEQKNKLKKGMIASNNHKSLIKVINIW